MEKEIIDNKTGVPLEHYKRRYRDIEPIQASEKSGVQYDAQDGAFKLKLLGRDVKLMHPELLLIDSETGTELPANATILIARLVLDGHVESAGGTFLAYNEMPWGELYYGNFRGRCIMRLAYGFGRDLSRFEAAAKALGGAAADAGDMSFDIEFIPGLLVRLIFWEGDEEFPASAQILFSDNFRFAWGAEDMAVVGDILIDRLKSA